MSMSYDPLLISNILSKKKEWHGKVYQFHLSADDNVTSPTNILDASVFECIQELPICASYQEGLEYIGLADDGRALWVFTYSFNASEIESIPTFGMTRVFQIIAISQEDRTLSCQVLYNRVDD